MVKFTPEDLAAMSSTLAKVSLYDPTFPKPDPMIAATYAEAIAPYKFSTDDLLDAVQKHYSNRTERISVADVIRNAREIRRERAERDKVEHYRQLGPGGVASPDVRAAIVARVRASSKSSQQSDAAAVAALGPLDLLDSDRVMEAFPTWHRSRAAKACVAARCLAEGIEPPKPWTAERRRLRPTRTPGSQAARGEARVSASEHLESRNMMPIFRDNAA